MTEKATFGAGCFWGVEETFRAIPGVTGTAVGYMGGTLVNPSYEDVCTNRTGHAEVVQVEYEPAAVSYERQGPDVGSQYRSVVFFHTPAQEAAARNAKEQLQAGGRFRRPIVTEITPAAPFYRAEEYHQRYLEKRGQSHCSTR
jgi:peptide-methionine (S)-S-oxide reductase